MNIENFFDQENSKEETTMNGSLTIFDWKTHKMILGENGEMLRFSTNGEACIYCGSHGLRGYLIDQIEPEKRSLLFGRK